MKNINTLMLAALTLGFGLFFAQPAQASRLALTGKNERPTHEPSVEFQAKQAHFNALLPPLALATATPKYPPTPTGRVYRPRVRTLAQEVTPRQTEQNSSQETTSSATPINTTATMPRPNELTEEETRRLEEEMLSQTINASLLQEIIEKGPRKNLSVQSSWGVISVDDLKQILSRPIGQVNPSVRQITATKLSTSRETVCQKIAEIMANGAKNEQDQKDLALLEQMNGHEYQRVMDLSEHYTEQCNLQKKQYLSDRVSELSSKECTVEVVPCNDQTGAACGVWANVNAKTINILRDHQIAINSQSIQPLSNEFFKQVKADLENKGLGTEMLEAEAVYNIAKSGNLGNFYFFSLYNGQLCASSSVETIGTVPTSQSYIHALLSDQLPNKEVHLICTMNEHWVLLTLFKENQKNPKLIVLDSTNGKSHLEETVKFVKAVVNEVQAVLHTITELN